MTSKDAMDRLIVALDAAPEDALALAKELQGHVSWLKIGMTLFYQTGPAVVSDLADMGFRIFLDLKLHDIPHQVEGAARAVAGLGAQILTVHASGGAEMVAAAVLGARRGADEAGVERPAVIAVTVLTSLDDLDMSVMGVTGTAAEQVARLAKMAQAAGADGVVCSPLETAAVRDILGDEAMIVTPGVRPSGAETGDQSRFSTPAQALANGATRIVIGRPITASANPAAAADRILAEMGDL